MSSIICGSPAWTFGLPQPCAGASVLLYTVCPVTKEVLLVLGQDSFERQLWSDFGGGSKKETDVQCAARELAEETHGIFPAITEARLHTIPKLVFHFPHANNLRRMMHYSMFMDRIPFTAVSRLRDAFAAAFLALPEATRAQHHVAEKADIRLVPLAEADSLPLRSFFRTRLQHATAFLQGTVCFLRKSVFLRGYYRRAIARRVARAADHGEAGTGRHAAGDTHAITQPQSAHATPTVGQDAKEQEAQEHEQGRDPVHGQEPMHGQDRPDPQQEQLQDRAVVQASEPVRRGQRPTHQPAHGQNVAGQQHGQVCAAGSKRGDRRRSISTSSSSSSGRTAGRRRRAEVACAPRATAYTHLQLTRRRTRTPPQVTCT